MFIQGSSLGLLLFRIYINDAHFCLQSSEATIYADNIQASYSSKSVSELHASNASEASCFVIGDTNIDFVQSAK